MGRGKAEQKNVLAAPLLEQGDGKRVQEGLLGAERARGSNRMPKPTAATQRSPPSGAPNKLWQDPGSASLPVLAPGFGFLEKRLNRCRTDGLASLKRDGTGCTALWEHPPGTPLCPRSQHITPRAYSPTLPPLPPPAKGTGAPRTPDLSPQLQDFQLPFGFAGS